MFEQATCVQPLLSEMLRHTLNVGDPRVRRRVEELRPLEGTSEIAAPRLALPAKVLHLTLDVADDGGTSPSFAEDAVTIVTVGVELGGSDLDMSTVLDRNGFGQFPR